MSEQNCAARKALEIAEEFIADEADSRKSSFLPEPTEQELGYLAQADYALATVRMALAAPCEHAAEVERVGCMLTALAIDTHRVADLVERRVAADRAERDQLRAELEKLKTELGAQLEFDRTALADAVTAINKTINSRFWLTEGRGSYGWDDDRYREEFGAAVKEISAAIEPLQKIGADWASCPKAAAEVAAARVDLKAQNQNLRAELDTLKAYLDSHALSIDLPIGEWVRGVSKCSATEAIEDSMKQSAVLRQPEVPR